ncbi:TonB-dependent receptor plug domain-containing protein [Costertonia aggregata]|uniref:TonB-dependent receptor plug domain-containing protein n=1 Tax=Costertonia aggregata TaxID=343403 RepID=A0A7H9AP17_9FLAO|nr:TonB-dependent receptor plug domain-containing protein [Costertonia aggregata]QLG45188.1 TonB-dependent receptor plug domain-containing protein [Costertonia aggregata]
MTRTIARPLTAILMLNVSIGVSQENPVFQNILGRLITYSTINSPEKTYIQTDKDLYSNGETIWYKTYLVDGVSHGTTDKSNVVYVELLSSSDSVVVRQKLFAQDIGAAGSIQIPEDIEQDSYTLRAYTKYMLNEDRPFLHSKKIPVWLQRTETGLATESDGQVQGQETAKAEQERPIIGFFPEGGDLVSGIYGKLGVKVTDTKGNGIALQGKIIDQNDNLVSPFKSHDHGLGQVSFVPETKKTYYASIQVNGKEERYTLPEVLERGYAMSIRNTGEHVTVKLSSNNMERGLEGTLLLGHIRGRTFYKNVQNSTDEKFSAKIMTRDLEDGVAHFTLFTSEGEPMCERLVFIDNPYNDIFLSAETDAPTYGQREKVSVELSVNGPMAANLSASVMTKTDRTSSTGPNIKSWLLLDSDIGRTVSNADMFFQDNTMQGRNLLDNLMLTHGWRRFAWKDMLGGKVNGQNAHAPEKGIMVKGRTTSFDNGYRPKKSLVSFSVLNRELFRENKDTDAMGNFSFGPFNFTDTIVGVIEARPMAKHRKQKENEIGIYVEDTFPGPKVATERNGTKTIVYEYPREYMEQTSKRKVQDFKYDPNVTRLKEVTVVEKKRKMTRKEIVNEKFNELTLYGEPDRRVITDSIRGGFAINVFDFLIGVAGVSVQGKSYERTVSIRGGATSIGSPSNNGGSGSDESTQNVSRPKEPLYLLDNVPVDNSTINTLNPSDIEFVDVLSGPRTGFYGSRGSNGVIAFYTRGQVYIEPEFPAPTPGVTDFKIPGFTKTREFYSPDYGITEKEHDKADYRTTLHWEPNIAINGSDTAGFSFYTGDAPGSYLVRVEGITTDGRPLSTVHSFVVEDVY